MHLVLENANDNDAARCHRCHWEGIVGELKKGDYFSLSNVTEVFCPQCKKYLGFIQHSSLGDEETGNSGNN